MILRQFDSSRSPQIDILAEVSPEITVTTFTVSELNSRKEPCRAADLVRPVPAVELFSGRDYRYAKPLAALIITTAGDMKDMARRLVGNPGIADHLVSVWGQVPKGALLVCFYDPFDRKLKRLPHLRAIGEQIAATAARSESERPKGIAGFLAHSGEDTIDLAAVIAGLSEAVVADPDLRTVPVISVVAPWFDGPFEVERTGMTPTALAGRNLMLTIGEAVSSGKRDTVKNLCSVTGGSWVGHEQFRGRKGALDYATLVGNAWDSLHKRLASLYLFTAETKNVEHTSTGYFDVGVTGQNVQERLSFVRGAIDREKPVLVLTEKFNDVLGRGLYPEAKAVLDQMDKIIAGSGQQHLGELTQTWCRHIIELARDGKVDEARTQLASLSRVSLIDPDRKREQEENIHWEAAWHAAQGHDTEQCRKNLLEWRRMAKASGRYTTFRDRALKCTGKLALIAFAENDMAAFNRETAEYGRMDADARLALHLKLGWQAIQAGEEEKGLAQLREWRQLIKHRGEYASSADRAAEVSLHLLKHAVQQKRDPDIAAEVDELYELLPDKFRDDEVRDPVRAWLLPAEQDLRLFTARATLLRNWPVVDVLLEEEADAPPELAYYRRAWELARHYDRAVTLRNMRRDEALKRGDLLPQYVALNRGLVLIGPITGAIAFGVKQGISPERMAELFQTARQGFNARQASLYNDAAASFFGTPELQALADRQEDLGCGVSVSSAFLERLLVDEDAEAAFFMGTDQRRPAGVLVLRVGPGRLARLRVSDRIERGIQEEMRNSMKHGASFKTALNVLDVRDAELAASFGAQLLAEVIREKGVECILSPDGRAALQTIHDQVPEGVRGFVIFNSLASSGGALTVTDSVVIPSDLDGAVVDKPRRNRTVAPYSVWDEPYFEVGIPIRRPGVRGVVGSLRLGVRGLPR